MSSSDTNQSNSQNEKLNLLQKEHTFTRENIKSEIVDRNKDYFAYTSSSDNKYSFLNPINYFYSKLFVKSFFWSVAIGSSFFTHRYFRTRSFRHSFRWGTVTMFLSFGFIWGGLEFQPFIQNFFYSQQLEKKRLTHMSQLEYKKYKEYKEHIYKTKENNNEISDYMNNTNQEIFVNSDFFARAFLESQNYILSTYVNESIDFSKIIKVSFVMNPFLDEDSIDMVDLSDEFESDEEEFYLNEIKEIGKDKYKIKFMYLDYNRLNEYGYFNDDEYDSAVLKKRLLDKYPKINDLLKKEEDELSSIEYDLKEMIMKSKRKGEGKFKDMRQFLIDNINISREIIKDSMSCKANSNKEYI